MAVCGLRSGRAPIRFQQCHAGQHERHQKDIAFLCPACVGRVRSTGCRFWHRSLESFARLWPDQKAEPNLRDEPAR